MYELKLKNNSLKKLLCVVKIFFAYQIHFLCSIYTCLKVIYKDAQYQVSQRSKNGKNGAINNCIYVEYK